VLLLLALLGITAWVELYISKMKNPSHKTWGWAVTGNNWQARAAFDKANTLSKRMREEFRRRR
jgi:hypothetical protein